MPKRALSFYASRQAGFSLMELMVGLGLSGIIFMTLIALMGQSATFSSVFHGSANTIEAVSTTLRQLHSVMPQVVSVNSCGCRGATSTSISNCIWSDTDPVTDPGWYDPHYNGGVTAGTEHLLFDGLFESYNGADTDGDGRLDLTKDTIDDAWGAALGGCESYDENLGSKWVQRGCKQRVRIYYTPAKAESGGTPSNAGSLRLKLGTAADVDQVATIGLKSGPGNYNVGAADWDGLNGIGVVKVSCGFVQGADGKAGTLFALNVRVKARSTIRRSPTPASLYESWHQAGANYGRGRFRDIQMKFAFPNLSNRGAYQWRTASQMDCKANGEDANSREQCCSFAWDGARCVACKRGGGASGESASRDSECCSGKLGAGGKCI